MAEIKIFDDIYNPIDIDNFKECLSLDHFPWKYRLINDKYGQKQNTVIDYGLDTLKKCNLELNNDLLNKMNDDACYFINDIYNKSSNTLSSDEFFKSNGFPYYIFLECLYIRSLLRMRVCMYLKTKEPYFFGYGYDYVTNNSDVSSVYTINQANELDINNKSIEPCNDSKISILCLHNSNGKIDIDGEVIDIKENRLICFPNNLRYSIVSQTDVDRLFLIHINYF